MSATSAADQHLRAFIDRILRLKEEQATIGDDIKEVYAEAKSAGYDKTAMGQVVSYLRKRDQDASKLEEQSAIFDLYLSAYDGPVAVAVASHTPAYARTRENIEEFPATRTQGGSDAKHAHHDRSSFDPSLIVGASNQPGQEAERQPPVETTNDEASGEGAADETSPLNSQSSEPNTSPAETKADDAPPVVSSADPFEPPAFLRDRPAPVLRPHCQRPENCGGYGSKHCGSCERASRQSEAA